MGEGPETLLPLDSWHRAQGARMVPFAGYAMPVQYEGIIAEHRWTRESASLFDVSHMGQLFVAGRDRDEALEALLPADIQGLALGQLRYSLLLDDQGGIIDDLIVARWRQGLYLVVNGATKAGDLAWMRERLPEGVAMNLMDDRAMLALQGPKAADALARHARGLDHEGKPVYGLDVLGFMTGGRFLIDDVEAWISRTGYTGEDGFEISVAAEDAETVADLLLGEPEVKPAGLGARDSLRLEAGLPLYGHDLDLSTGPIEAGLGFAIPKRRRETGGFPGAGRVLGDIERGAASRRVGLAVEGRQPVREGATVVDAEGQDIGRVTSGGFSPTLEAPIAMAYVPAALAAPGTPITLTQRGKPFAAKVVPLPFVPHRYHRKGARP